MHGVGLLPDDLDTRDGTNPPTMPVILDILTLLKDRFTNRVIICVLRMPWLKKRENWQRKE